jgi:hypothetical protein
LAVLVEGGPALDVVSEKVVKGTMWVVEEDFGTTKLLIAFSMSRVTNKLWPDINYIWFCPMSTTPFVLA